MAGDSIIHVHVSTEGAEGGRLVTSQSDAGLPTPMDTRGEAEGVSDAGLPTPSDSQGEGNSSGSEPGPPKAPKGNEKDGAD
jgi:hypothetical protein